MCSSYFSCAVFKFLRKTLTNSYMDTGFPTGGHFSHFSHIYTIKYLKTTNPSVFLQIRPCFFLVVGFQLPSKRATTDITFTAQMIIYNVHLKQKTFWYQVFFSEFRYHFRVAQECSKTKGLVWEWLLPFFMEWHYHMPLFLFYI